MVGAEIPLRAPTSFLFFAASAVAAYYSAENPSMYWFAYAAFCFFLAIGPIRWIESIVDDMPWRDWRGEEHYDQPHANTPSRDRVFGVFLILVLTAGAVCGGIGLYFVTAAT